MAIKVTGYFPNKGNHTFTKDPIIKLEVKQSPMGKLDVNCLISIDVEGNIPSNIGTTTYSLIVHNFTMNNISRETLLFDELIVDPYDKLLFAVQDYVSESLQSEYPDLTFEQVCGWLDAGVDVEAEDAKLDANIANQIDPPVIVLPNPWDVAPE